jgi:protoporphyrinogen oxidase
MTQNVAIVGSGFLGMTLALRFAEDGDRVTLFEAAEQIGGLASSWEIGDVLWDKHYHVTLASDSYTRKIVEELGLGDQFNWVETKTGFYTGGELVSMSNTLEFLKFPPLGPISKLRLGATIFIASRIKDWRSLEKVSVEDWLVKLSGRRTFEKIWKPLLMAKLGLAYKKTSAAFIWATIQRMYAARNSGLKKELFGYVRGGYARVLERFGQVLASKNVDIRLKARVQTVEKLENGKFRIHLAPARRRTDVNGTVQKTKYGMIKTAAVVAPGFSGAFLSEPDHRSSEMPTVGRTFDRVILTCPSGVASRMAPQLTNEEKELLDGIRYQGIICASVLTKCSLSDYYVTNITDESPFTGIIEMSAMVDKKEFGRNALIYLPKYVPPDDPLFDKSDDEIEDIFLSALGRMYKHFKRQDVLAFKVSRVRQVFPLPVIGYSFALASKRTSLDGLYVVNSSHIVNGTLNVNETVQLAEQTYSELRNEL